MPLGYPPGYIVARSFIANSKEFGWRRPIVAKLLETVAGRYLVRTEAVETVVGNDAGFALTVVELPSLTVLEQTLSSPDLAALLSDMQSHGRLDIWGVPGFNQATPAPGGPGSRGYLVARAQVSGVQRLSRPNDLLLQTVVAAGGRIVIRSGDIDVIAGKLDANWITVIEMPTLAALKAALPDPHSPDTAALWRSMGVQDVWIAPGVE